MILVISPFILVINELKLKLESSEIDLHIYIYIYHKSSQAYHEHKLQM